MVTPPLALRLTKIKKAFNGVLALDDVSLDVAAGSVHGILGENGAGKTTLMNIIAGLLRPGSGSMQVMGRTVPIGSVRASRETGIGMVHQHFKLVDSQSVLDNIVLAISKSVWARKPRKLMADIEHWCRELNWTLNLHAAVGELGVGEQQRVEIIKALCGGGKILILDEPTAALTPVEVDELALTVAALANVGMAVLFISHKLNEVMRMCRAISILRRGRLVYSGDAAALSIDQIAETMVGAKVDVPRLMQSRSRPAGQALLELDAVDYRLRRRGPPLLQQIHLSVHAGEILGIAGVDGNGQRELAAVISGTAMPTAGQIRRTRRPAAPAKQFAYIPEDRHKEALVLPLSVDCNIVLRKYRHRPFVRWGFCRFGQWRRYAENLVREYDIRCRQVDDAAGTLSGGNQQKLVLARELSDRPELILAVNPTRGLDVGATAFVMRQLLDARAGGAGIILIHGDLDELLSVSDTVAVLNKGKLLTTPWPDATPDQIGRMMLTGAS
jgi:simple sugar transport system ATP-binding protein